MTNTIRTYCLWLLLLLAAPVLDAQTRVWDDNRHPHWMMGGGNTRYSRHKDGFLVGHNGLRTGQYSDVHRLIGVYYEGDYTTYLSAIQKASMMPGGYGQGAGLVYEHQSNSFIFHVGAGFHVQNVYTAVADTTFYKYHVADTWTNNVTHQNGAWTGQVDTFYYDMRYDFYNRCDQSRVVYAHVPLYFGQLLPSLKGHGVYYYLAGLKFSYALRGSTEVHATGTTTADYDRYIGIFYEMDNHGWRRDVPINRVGQPMLKLDWDVMAHAEAGYEWGIYSPERGWRGQKGLQPLDLRFRLAAFAEVSLRNISPNTNLPLCDVPDESKWDFPTYRFNHIYATDQQLGCQMRNLYAGVKLTVLLGFKGKEHCVLCNGRGERAMSKPY